MLPAAAAEAMHTYATLSGYQLVVLAAPADAMPRPFRRPNRMRPLPVAKKVQDRIVEQSWVLQKREMARVGQDQQSGAWDRRGNVLRVLALDRLVVVAVYHQHRGSD